MLVRSYYSDVTLAVVSTCRYATAGVRYNKTAQAQSSSRARSSHLILGAGSASYVLANQFSNLCCMDAHYWPLKNWDAIALSSKVLGTRMPHCW